jgi:hypothetical protein
MLVPKRAKRALAAVLGVGALITTAAVLTFRGEPDEAPFRAVTFVQDSTTVECEGSVVSLDFDPEGHIEARVRGETIAAADAARRGINYDACTSARTQRGWSQRGARYARANGPTELRCRFPGRFSVHVTTVSPSWAGERPAGSAVYLVLGKRLQAGSGPNRTIVASASVLERPDESRLVFARGYCRAP